MAVCRYRVRGPTMALESLREALRTAELQGVEEVVG